MAFRFFALPATAFAALFRSAPHAPDRNPVATHDDLLRAGREPGYGPALLTVVHGGRPYHR